MFQQQIQVHLKCTMFCIIDYNVLCENLNNRCFCFVAKTQYQHNRAVKICKSDIFKKITNKNI